MKKIISMFVLLMFTLSTFVPLCAYADKDNEGLDAAIKTAKTIFTVPDECKDFSFQMDSTGKVKVFSLVWSNKKEYPAFKSVNVSIDEFGNVISYYISDSKQRDYSEVAKLPKIRRDEAKDQAIAFLKKVYDGKIDVDNELEINLNNMNYDRVMYNFSFNRLYNKIPYIGDNIYVIMDANTGVISSLNANWNFYAKLDTTDKIIDIAAAKESYIKNIGIELKYVDTYENNKSKIVLRYEPSAPYSVQYIDAKTGEKISFDNNDGYYRGGYAGAYDSKMKNSMQENVKYNYTEEELKEIKNVANLTTKDEAEKLLMAIPEFKVDSSYKFESFNYNKRINDTDTQYVISLSYVSSESKRRSTIYVEFNAVTKELLSYYKGYDMVYTADEKVQSPLSKDKESEIAKAFMGKYKSDYLKKTVVDVQNGGNYYPNNNDSVRFVRVENNIKYANNAFDFAINNQTGEIMSFSSNWDKTAQFISPEKVIPAKQASEVIFDKAKFTLRYITDTRGKTNSYQKDLDDKAILVYSLDNMASPSVDAFTGEMVDYSDNANNQNQPVDYKDIKGHYAEKIINELKEYGIALFGEEFKPDDKITQKDFLILIGKIVNNYYPVYLRNDQLYDKVTEMYGMFVGNKIIDENEKNPDGFVTREDGVRYLLRQLGYGKISDVKGIFICDFKDADQISEKNKGYAAVSKALNIISGFDGYFYPTKNLTRADAVIMIYNYLKQ